MRNLARGFLAGLIKLALWSAPVPTAAAAGGDTSADHVLGQALLTTGDPNQGNLSASSQSGPGRAVEDRHTSRPIWSSVSRTLFRTTPTTAGCRTRVCGTRPAWR